MGYKKIVKSAYSKNRYKYLGSRVKDSKKKGLDSVQDFLKIKKAIVEDYRSGKISEKTARGRLLLLYRLTFKEKNSKIEHIPEQELKKLRDKIKDTMNALDEE
ncbi:hypothetical protein [Thermococcus eurythermalis]|uniref:hypothetical protein n=1 Tax=Thermococcus eurythermalis TaxID=1505907 RepID=UPI000678F54A|nr:hypothetical protein [Thermococcus eurythermalis]